jgi:hypothetical protein
VRFGQFAGLGLGGPTNKNLELAGWTGPDAKVMTLRKGNVVVAPDQDTVVETAWVPDSGGFRPYSPYQARAKRR